MSTFDIIVLGSGPGGYTAAIRAAQLGMKAAVVEKEALGGVCLNWGCIPTKALLKSAEILRELQRADSYGIQAKEVSFDFNKIIQRSRNIATHMSKGIQFLMRKNKITVIDGYGKVKPGKRVEVTNQEGSITEYKASHIIIATGGRPKTISSLSQDNRIIFDYKKALSLDKLPQSLVIVGAGAIGCEFAHFYSTLGVEITLIEYFNRILPNEDEEISAALQKSFQKSGVQILTTSRVIASRIHNGQATLIVSTPKGEIELHSEAVLSAIGISANTDNIGLEYTGIEWIGEKIKTDAFGRTNVDGYYAIGDVTQGPALAHVASAEAIICVEKIAGLNPIPISYNNIPSCTYTQPEVASVGLTEEKAREKGYDILTGKFPFTASGKAQASGHAEGFVKVIFDKKYGELLGVHLIGANVTEMIAELVLAKNLEATADSILHSVHPHPTLSEAVVEAVAAAYNRVIHL